MSIPEYPSIFETVRHLKQLWNLDQTPTQYQKPFQIGSIFVNKVKWSATDYGKLDLRNKVTWGVRSLRLPILAIGSTILMGSLLVGAAVLTGSLFGIGSYAKGSNYFRDLDLHAAPVRDHLALML